MFTGGWSRSLFKQLIKGTVVESLLQPRPFPSFSPVFPSPWSPCLSFLSCCWLTWVLDHMHTCLQSSHQLTGNQPWLSLPLISRSLSHLKWRSYISASQCFCVFRRYLFLSLPLTLFSPVPQDHLTSACLQKSSAHSSLLTPSTLPPYPPYKPLCRVSVSDEPSNSRTYYSNWTSCFVIHTTHQPSHLGVSTVQTPVLFTCSACEIYFEISAIYFNKPWTYFFSTLKPQ